MRMREPQPFVVYKQALLRNGSRDWSGTQGVSVSIPETKEHLKCLSYTCCKVPHWFLIDFMFPAQITQIQFYSSTF